MKRKDSTKSFEKEKEDTQITPKSPPLEIRNLTKPLKRYKSENIEPTYDPKTYTETLDKFKPARGCTENSNLLKRKADRQAIFDENTVLVARFKDTLEENLKDITSFHSYSSNSSNETDPSVKNERELAFIRGRLPGYVPNIPYDPTNAENLPQVKTQVKQRIEVDVSEEIYIPRFSDSSNDSNETKPVSNSDSDEGESSQEDGFSIAVEERVSIVVEEREAVIKEDDDEEEESIGSA